MVTIDCPWCDAPVALQAVQPLRCEDCRIEVEIDPVVREIALAA